MYDYSQAEVSCIPQRWKQSKIHCHCHILCPGTFHASGRERLPLPWVSCYSKEFKCTQFLIYVLLLHRKILTGSSFSVSKYSMFTPNISELPNITLKTDRRDLSASLKAGLISHPPEDAQAITATQATTGAWNIWLQKKKSLSQYFGHLCVPNYVPKYDRIIQPVSKT